MDLRVRMEERDSLEIGGHGSPWLEILLCSFL